MQREYDNFSTLKKYLDYQTQIIVSITKPLTRLVHVWRWSGMVV